MSEDKTTHDLLKAMIENDPATKALYDNIVEEAANAMKMFAQSAAKSGDSIGEMAKAIQKMSRPPGVYFVISGGLDYDDSRDPLWPGWHVVYEVEVEAGHAYIIDPQGSLQTILADQVESLEAAWQFVDYLCDDEVGVPRAIKHDAEVMYVFQDNEWRRYADNAPPVPDEYI